MSRYYLRILSTILLVLLAPPAAGVAVHAQEIEHPVIINRFSYFMPLSPADAVFITEDKRIEYTLTGYASLLGQLSFKKRINLFRGAEIGFGIGLPYTIVMAKFIFKESDAGTLMIALDIGLMERGLELGVPTTLGKAGVSYGTLLNNGINRKIELGYSWYTGFIGEFPIFPRSRAFYSTITFEKMIGRRINVSVFGGPTIGFLRYRLLPDGASSTHGWGNITYVDLIGERQQKDKVYDWSRQFGFNVGITINYEL